MYAVICISETHMDFQAEETILTLADEKASE